ncbi:SDR family NAD(P)-dependent oxidoreductase [Sporolactobacillus sp. KGMB 08714]|uniref:SDR family NAD(P)-dependent oxidoreductase n=1 Tax=Sporolactobacillus sp. KGMB 08714 TaxID=3064704 RepID=UPI002FBDAECF
MLKNKVILIIGGTAGFGKHVAMLAAQKGANLIIVGRHKEKLDSVKAELQQYGNQVEGHTLDVSKEEDLKKFFDSIGKIDHLVSTAGGFMGGGFLDAALETILKTIHDKLFINLRIARLAASHLKANGSMVFTAGSGGKPNNASGAIIGNDAIRTMVQGLAVELAPRARINAVAPTWTRTSLYRDIPEEEVDQTQKLFSGMIPLGRTANISEVAMTYIFLMENSFITGQTIVVDGGLTLV